MQCSFFRLFRCIRWGRFKIPCRPYQFLRRFLAGAELRPVIKCTNDENEDQLHSNACLDHDHGRLSMAIQLELITNKGNDINNWFGFVRFILFGTIGQ